jgi:hypothetical protein
MVGITIILKRRSVYYLLTFTLPAFGITCLALAGLFTPTTQKQERTEKCTMGLTALLTMSVILLIVTDLMPKTSHMPKLGLKFHFKHSLFTCVARFMLWEMIITGIATLAAITVMYFHSWGAFGHSVPRWLLLFTCQRHVASTLPSTNKARAASTDVSFIFVCYFNICSITDTKNASSHTTRMFAGCECNFTYNFIFIELLGHGSHTKRVSCKCTIYAMHF